MYRILQGLDRLILLFGTPGVVPGFILKNQEETACDRLMGADLLHKVQVILLHQPALLVFFLGHLTAHSVQMPVNIRAASQNLDLQLDGRDLQIGYKGIDDVPLLPGAAQHKVDGNDLYNLHKTMIFGINNAVCDLLNGKIVRHRIDASRLFLPDVGGPFRRAFFPVRLFCLFARFLDRRLLFRTFLRPELFTNLIAADFIKLGGKVGFPGSPVFWGPGRLFTGRTLLEMPASRL